ncbi:aminotransferase-like domain-containing protein [Streptomyces sp. NRAIS4]
MTPASGPATAVLDAPAPVAAAGHVLHAAELHSSLTDPALTSMTLLSEIAVRYPGALSFATGLPYQGDYETAALPRYVETYTRYLTEERGLTPEQVTRTLFQYGRTTGIINDLLARHLSIDENLTVDPDAIVVTTGCQEAMILVLRALRRDARDVVFAADPTYVGFTGASRLVDMTVRPVREGDGGLDPGDLVAQIRQARADGLNPRACYVIPDFANPSGAAMPVDDRLRLLRIAEEEGLLLLEDNPYSMFHSGGTRPPTIKSLDRAGHVVYLGSFSKTAFPGARIGYVVADQRMAEGGRFADQLVKLKSMLTLNTSTVAQAAIGGLLVEHGCSVEKASARAADVYRRNGRALLDGLKERFGGGPDARVRWNSPSGGMFAVLTVPFRADDEALEESARDFGVLWAPMHHFYAGTGGTHQLRLSFSVLTPEEIGVGLDRLAAFVAHRTA